jgi:steroid delta-isomerase-like uncharacterized protein
VAGVADEALARRAWEAIGKNDLGALDDLYAADCVIRPAAGPPAEGLDAFKEMLTMLDTAFDDLQIEIHDVISGEGLVASRFTLQLTHKGAFMGIPATGKQLTVPGMDFSRVVDGEKITKVWGGMDQMSLMQQLGATLTFS